MFSNYLHLFSYNFLIIGILIASFYSHVFAEEPGQNLQDAQEFASLEIISEPENAHVFINQEYKGVTPYTVDSLRSGTHSIELKLDNYKPFSEKITVEEGAYKKLVIELSKMYGTLKIISSPENACIVLNGDSIAKTPFIREKIKTGTYSVSLSKENFKTYQTIVSVNGGKTDTIDVTLRPLFSITKILSTPDKADVIINDSTFGKTPLQCETLHPGAYVITISKDGYQPQKIRTKIRKDSINIINANLLLKEIADSLNQLRKRKSRNFRRILLSSLTIGFLVPGIFNNSKISNAQKEEEKTWNKYMQPNLTELEYDQLYKIYTAKVNETNKYVNKRNTYFIIAGAAGIGLAISIPF